jgi:DNA polymerase I-like protein with 3'-5' exonuclease and polymerase domains
MIELFEKPDDPPYFGSYHLLNASIVYPEKFWPLAEKKGAFKEKYAATIYQWVKNGGFAKQYGAQAAKVDSTFHREGAYALLSKSMPNMERLNQDIIALANRQGYVETIPDKTVNPDRGYPILCTRNKWNNDVSPTVPLNYHVQSTAMWCTMKAMIRCFAQIQEWRNNGYNAAIVMQVHDEMVFDLPKGGKRSLPKVRQLRRLMEQSGEDIGIPLKVAASYHPNNWAESCQV